MKYNKLNIVFICIMCLVFIANCALFSFYKLVNREVNYNNKADLNARIIILHNPVFDGDEVHYYGMNNGVISVKTSDALKITYNKDEFLKLDYKNKHIVRIDENYTNYKSPGRMLDIGNNIVYLYPNYDGFTPEVVMGRELKEDNEIICPKIMNLNGNSVRSYYKTFKGELTNMEDYLNKDLTFTYEADDKVTKTFTLVGLYDPVTSNNFDKCYITENANSFNEESDNKKESTSLAIFVDKFENTKKIRQDLNENGIFYEHHYDELYNALSLKMLILLLTLISIVVFVVIIIIYYNLYLTKSNQRFMLYKALGYNKKQIIKVFEKEIGRLLLMSLIYAFFIIFGLNIAAYIYVHQFAYFYHFNMLFAYIETLLFLLIYYIVAKLVIRMQINLKYDDLVLRNYE